MSRADIFKRKEREVLKSVHGVHKRRDPFQAASGSL